MHPVLLDFHCRGRHVVVSAYAAAMVTAAVLFLVAGWSISKRRGLPSGRVLICLALILAAVALGGRSMHVLMRAQFYHEHPERIWSLDFGRFAFQGAALAGLVVGRLTCWRLRMNALRLADASAPGLFAAIALVRVGCFLNGCCFGKETTAPWGVTFPPGSPAQLHFAGGSVGLWFQASPTLHPTQLYEALASTAAMLVAAYLLRRRAPDGAAFLVGATLFAAFQGINFLWRTPIGSSPYFELVYPLIPVGFSCAGLAILFRNWNWSRS